MDTVVSGREDLILEQALPEQGQISSKELPRQRLLRLGVEALKDHELLAIILGTGFKGYPMLTLAHNILASHSKGDLLGLDVATLSRHAGMGEAKASLLLAAFEFARRALDQGLGILPVIVRPIDTVALVVEIKDQRKEHFLGLFLNARNQVIHKEVISIGSLTASIVHPREVFQVALNHTAASIILVHNHPSGDVSPSKEDIALTQRLVAAGEIMGVEVLDHIIIGSSEILSFREQGIL